MTAPRIRIRVAARRDINAYSDHLLAEAGPETAARFVDSAFHSFAALAQTPRMGTALHSQNPALGGIRKWRVSGFPKLLIFYRPVDGVIRIIRVLHASQDWWALLDVN